MEIKFTKMHGLGNDFMVIDGINQQISLSEQQIRQLADRHTGIGFDQLLMVDPPASPQADFAYRIFNSDGREVEQCGNGARCFAKFVTDQGLTRKSAILVETNSGQIVLQPRADGQVTVDMGVPRFSPDLIPFVGTLADRYSILVDNEEVEIGVVSMGNPHAVLCVENVQNAPVERLGPLLESHSRFPQRVNVGFMQILDRNAIRLRVYERGVGETRACGTGACAAMVIGHKWELLNDQVDVMLPGGKLKIEWSGEEGSAVLMTGPAQSVFEGCVSI